MSKLIQIIHPYQVRTIKNISDYLFIVKNLCNKIEKQGYYKKKDGVLIPIRWSQKKESWVIDRCSSKARDSEGVCLSELDKSGFPLNLRLGASFILNEIKDNYLWKEFAEKYNLFKNPDRVVCFEFLSNKINRISYNDTNAFVIGMFLRNRTKKRDNTLFNENKGKLIDNSKEFQELISKCSDKFLINELIKCEKNNIYNDFIGNVNNLQVKFKTSNSILELLKQNNNISYRKININGKKYDPFSFYLFKKIENNEIDFNSIKDSKYINNYLIMKINFELGEFIKKQICKNNNEEGIIIHDKINNVFFKFTGYFNFLESEIELNEKNENDKINFDYKYFLPGVF